MTLLKAITGLDHSPAGNVTVIPAVVPGFIWLLISVNFACTNHQFTGKIPADTLALYTPAADPDNWIAPDSTSIPEQHDAELILYGKQLLARTAAYYGP
jgi:hypothetical protein